MRLLILVLLLLTPAYGAIENVLDEGSRYRVHLDERVDEKDINVWYTTDDGMKYPDIKSWSGTSTGTTFTVEKKDLAYNLVIYINGEYSIFDLSTIDGTCDGLDLQKPGARDCAYEADYQWGIRHARYYEDTGVLAINIENTQNTPQELHNHNLWIDYSRGMSATFKENSVTLQPGEHYVRKYWTQRNKPICGEPFFIGIIKGNQFEGVPAEAFTHADLECFKHEPKCGDFVCSTYEEFDCPADCEAPINLNLKKGALNGITFDYSYYGDTCVYTVIGPDEQRYKAPGPLENYYGEDDGDLAYRYEDAQTAQLPTMFSDYVSGSYQVRVECNENGRSVTEQSGNIAVCLECVTEDDCVPLQTLRGSKYCDKNRQMTSPNWFSRMWLSLIGRRG